MPRCLLAASAALLAGLSWGKAPDGGRAPDSEVPVIWRDPPNIASLNLYYGPGGRAHVPTGPFTFLEEDLDGTSPKYIVKDTRGIKWTVKAGPEAQPEVAASRLVWAAGYFANEDYYLPEVRLANLPLRLHRGQNQVQPGGILRGVRLKRHLAGERKLGQWAWSENPFTDTREFNGLRVIMSLINNWDLTDENNAVYQESEGAQKGLRILMVKDVGSTFGTGKLSWPMRYCRGNLGAYGGSRFVTRVTADYVDFHAPAGASWFFLATPREYRAKARIRWIGRHIPLSDARWVGEVLARLSKEQINDAFRAAGYEPAEVDGFASEVQSRIRELQRL